MPFSSKVSSRLWTCQTRLASPAPLLPPATSHQYPHLDSLHRPQNKRGLEYSVSTEFSRRTTSSRLVSAISRKDRSSCFFCSASPAGPFVFIGSRVAPAQPD